MTAPIRPYINLARAPQQYSAQDQNELRRALMVAIDSVTNAATNQTTTLTGDVTGSGSTSIATTLATVNASPGSIGSSTEIPTVTVNAKGLVTAVTTNAVIAPAGTLTGTTLAANVVTSSLTTIGTLVAGAVPASLVTAGTFGSGAYAVAAGSTTNALTVTTTGTVQTSFRYDASNRLDVEVGSTGICTLRPAGAAARVVIGLLTLTTTDMAYVGGGFTVENTGPQLTARYNSTGGNNLVVSVGSGGDATVGPSGAFYDKNMILKYRVSIIDESGSASTADTTALYLPASTATFSPIRLSPGVAPSSPANGDMWTTTVGVFNRVNGVTWEMASLLTRLDQFAAPTASVSFNAQQATSFLIENRTDDTGCTQEGRLWLRTDL